MKYNTRFNPTVSGLLHVGHLYNALVNATEAHRSGGKFLLRIDDTQEQHRRKFGSWGIRSMGDIYVSELSKFMQIDAYGFQSEMEDIKTLANMERIVDSVGEPMLKHDQLPDWISFPDVEMFPYAPKYTLEKVVWDFHEHINWLIRGEDLISEFSLYCYFVDVLGLPRVFHTFIPRLKSATGEITRVSKSLGTYKLGEQISIFGISGVLDLLKNCCLINPEGDFVVENIKWNPTISGFIE